MGTIILFTCLSLLMTFLLGAMIASDEDNEIWIIIDMFFLGACIGLSIIAISQYYEKKEYSSTEYELNKKIVTVDENNTVKVDTLYFLEKRK